jgi:WD40 repeat protein
MNGASQFERVAYEVSRLRAEVAAGRLDRDRFHSALRELMFQHEGRWWMIGADSGKWYVRDENKWVEISPPAAATTASAVAAPAPSPVVTPVSSARPVAAARGPGGVRVLREGRRLQGEIGGSEGAAAFSPDGRYVLTCGDAAVHLSDVAGGGPPRAFRVQFPKCVAYAPGSRSFVTGEVGGVVRVWDGSTGQELCNRKAHGGAVKFVGFLPDGERVVSAGSDKAIAVTNIGSGSEVHRIAGGGDLNCVALSADGSTLLAHWGQSWESDLRFYDPGTGRELRRFSPGQVALAVLTSVALSPCGDLAVLGDTNEVIVIASDTGRVVRKLTPPGQIMWVALSPDGRRVLAGTGAEQPTIEESNREWDSLYAELTKRPMAHKVHIWDAASGAELYRCEGHSEPVTAVAASPDGRVALSASVDGTARLWDLD